MKRNCSKQNRFLPALLSALIIIAAGIAIGRLYGEPAPPGKVAVCLSELSERSGFSDGSVEVHFLDVGQGDCALIKSDDGKWMLIDAGTPDSSQKILDYLAQNHVDTIEYAVFTHPHADHIGGALAVLDAVTVKTVFMPDAAHTSSTYLLLVEKMLEQKEKRNLRVLPPRVGERYEFGGASFVILAPDGIKEGDYNNASIVLKLVYREISFLFTGDAEKASEKQMLAGETELDSDVLKVGHHGSATSSGKEFLNAVNPKIAVISCGADNGYGHPHRDVLERFDERGVLIFRTDRDGDIVVVTDGEDCQLFTGK